MNWLLPAYQVDADPFKDSMTGFSRALSGAVGQHAKNAREQRDRMALTEGLARTPGIGLERAEALARVPEVGRNALMQYSDPNLALRKRQADAEAGMMPLKRQQIEHGMRMADAQLVEQKRWHDMQNDRQKSQAEQTGYGKQGTIIQGPDGRHYTVQFAENGTRKIEPLQIGGEGPPQQLTPSRGVGVVGDTIYDKSTGRTVSSATGAIEGGAAAKERGERIGQAQMDQGRVEDNAEQMLTVIERARSHPGRAYATGPVAGKLPAIGGDQAGFVAYMDQIQGKAFLEAFNSLKGGGQITEAEGRKATEAIGRLNRVQSPRDFEIALNDLRDVVTAGRERARRSAGRPQQSAPAQGPAGAVAPPPPRSTDSAPRPGDVFSGAGGSFRFKGGDPGNPASWEKVQ